MATKSQMIELENQINKLKFDLEVREKAHKAELEKKAGSPMELTFDVDDSILGGVVLKVGDRVLDASLRAQLENLRETFKRGK